MSISDSIDTLREAGQADFDAVVEAMADGTTPSPKQVRDALAAAGKSFDDLEGDVQRRVARREAAGDLATADSLQSEIVKAEQARREALANLAEARAEANRLITEAVGPANEAERRVKELRDRQQTLRAEAGRILRSTAEPGIETQLGELRRRRSWLLDMLAGLDHREPNTIESEMVTAKRSEAELAGMGAGDEAGIVRERIVRLQKELTDARVKAAASAEPAAELAEVEAEINRLENSKLTP